MFFFPKVSQSLKFLTCINDRIKETEWWACFHEDEERETDEFPEEGHEYDDDYSFDGNGYTIKRTHEKVGRNDSCPCGSGKKYKKCCGKED